MVALVFAYLDQLDVGMQIIQFCLAFLKHEIMESKTEEIQLEELSVKKREFFFGETFLFMHRESPKNGLKRKFSIQKSEKDQTYERNIL
jgi:hypothetical protein